MIRSAAVALIAMAFAMPADAAERAFVHHRVSTAFLESQQTFDEGMLMLYAFDVGEARTRFKAVAGRDPHCAMAQWGLAVAETIDINHPTTPEGELRGAEAIARARDLEPYASADERALIEATVPRYIGAPHVDDRMEAFAKAMNAYASTHPSDADANVIAAIASWNTADDFLDEKKAWTPQATEIDRDLARAVAAVPHHPGALHMLVHFREEVGEPERGRTSADLLTGFDYPLGASHLEHMPGHIYTRLGDYDALIASNERAVDADRAFFASESGDGPAYMHNYENHNLDFVLYGLTTVGRDDEAARYAEKADAMMRARLALRLHHNEEAMQIASGTRLASYRSLAAARLGQEGPPLQPWSFPGARKLAAAFTDAERNIVAGARARRAGRYDEAAVDYKAALDEMAPLRLGDPKAFWWAPAGEAYGAVLLQAHRFADAEAAFRAELTRFPNDPHLAFGLAEALHAQGKDDREMRALVRARWRGSRQLRVEDLG